MKLVKHNNFIYEYQNFVDDELCDSFIEMIEHEKEDVISNKKCSIKNKTRNNVAFNITELSKQYNLIKIVDMEASRIISKSISKYVDDNILVRRYSDFTRHSNFDMDLIYRFYDKDDYYDWHVDSTEKGHFVLSIIIYLNDDFEGGSTIFLEDKVKVNPKKGSVLIFPCDYRTIHKGTKVKSGTKKIIWTCLNRKLC